MKFYANRTVDEQAARLPVSFREPYRRSQIDRITIFDGKNEVELTGYAEYSYLDEKSYATQPVRTQDGQIQEIDEYKTIITPHLIIKYNMMNIDDYRATMKMIKSTNSLIVRCYDVVEDKRVVNEMYVAPSSMPAIYQQYLMALGIREHTIELIGTNVPIGGENGTKSIVFYITSALNTTHKGVTWREWIATSSYPWTTINSIYGEVISDDGGSSAIYKPNSGFVNADDFICEDTYYEVNNIR